MAENTTTLKKQFLDYAGLQQFWAIIDAKFANKTDAVKVESFNFDTTTNSVTMVYTDSAATPKSYGIALPMAKSGNLQSDNGVAQAGLLSASDKAIIDDLENKINDMAPFHGLKIGGKEIYLPGKRGNIGLDFVTGGSVEDGTRTAKIELVDLAYRDAYGTNKWVKIEKSEYEANASNDAYYAHNNEYYKWSQDNVKGPTNNLGLPLIEAPISSIDVSELVKAGLLNDADVVYRPKDDANGIAEGMYLKLVFITNGAGTETKEVFINVTDLVDIYTAGEGIEIANDAMNSDSPDMETGSARTGTISVKVATAEKLGAVKLGYTDDANKQLYHVQVDESGNAFVAVPWKHTTVNVTTGEANVAGEKYLVVTQNNTLNTTDANGNPLDAYSFNIEVGAGIKNAENLAGTSVQSITVGDVSEDDGATGVSKDDYIKVYTEQMSRIVDVTTDTGTVQKTINAGTKVVASLTDSAEASLGLADTAVQNIITSNVERAHEKEDSPHYGDGHTPTGNDLVVSLVNTAGTAYGTEKGQKTIKVTLGEKTVASLDKADTALQTVKIFDTTLDIDNAVYTVADGKKSLSLGTASNADVVEAIPEGEIGEGEGKLTDADFKSNIPTWDGEESRYTVATTKAVKVYVDAENTAQSETLRTYTDEAIKALDVAAEDASVGYENPTHADYIAAYGSGVQPHQVMIGLAQEDGKITNPVGRTLSITDIADFAPISKSLIESICGMAVPETPVTPAE